MDTRHSDAPLAAGKDGNGQWQTVLGRRAGASIGLAAGRFASVCLVAAAAGCAGWDEAADLASRTGAVEVSAELELDPADLLGAAGQEPGGLLVRAGDHYLALWLDDRASFGLKPADHGFVVMGTRVDPSGAVLDPAGFLVAQGPAFGGFETRCNPDGLCLVVIVEDPFDPQSRMFGVRVSENQVLDPTPILLAGPGSRRASVAWDGAAFRILWVTHSAGAFTALVGEDGAIGAAAPVPVEELDSFNAVHQLECGGPRCLFTYLQGNGDGFDVVGRMLETDGSVSDELTISAGPIDNFGAPPVWDGVRYWVAVEHMQGPVPTTARLVRVEIDGTILDPAGLLVGTGPSAFPLHLSEDGGQLIVSWQTSSSGGLVELRSARVTLGGEVLDPGGVPFTITSPPDRFEIEILYGLECHTSTCLLLVGHRRGMEDWLRGFRLDGATVVDPEGVIVTASPPAQADAAVVYGSGRYLAVWRDSQFSDRGTLPLRGALFSSAMNEFVPFEIDTVVNGTFFGSPQIDPTAAASASAYLVAWSAPVTPATADVYGEVLGPNGDPIRRTFAIQQTTRPESHPSAASSGDGFLVVWERLDPKSVHAIRASRFDPNGVPLPPEQFLVTASGFLPVAAFDGADYLVVWQRPKSPSDSRRDLAAARVSPSGEILDPAGIVIADGVPVDHAQSVACGGGVCLVAWHTGGQVRALRIAPDGTVLDPGGISLAAGKNVSTTSVAFDGTGFLVGWQTKTGDMHGAEVSLDGFVTSPEFVLANESTALQNPVAASDGAGHRFVLYDRFDPSPDYNVRRIRARVLDCPTCLEAPP